jgi:hypothetical protein
MTFRWYPSRIPTFAFGQQDVDATGRRPQRSSTIAVGSVASVMSSTSGRVTSVSPWSTPLAGWTSGCRRKHQWTLSILNINYSILLNVDLILSGCRSLISFLIDKIWFCHVCESNRWLRWSHVSPTRPRMPSWVSKPPRWAAVPSACFFVLLENEEQFIRPAPPTTFLFLICNQIL